MSDLKNEIIYERDFLKDAGHLPLSIQKKLSELIEVLREDPFDPQLHTKQLSTPLQGMFSFRITRGYRAGFKFYAQHTIQLLAIDRRDKIYGRLRRKT